MTALVVPAQQGRWLLSQWALLPILALLTVVLFLVSLQTGPVTLSIAQVVSALQGLLTGQAIDTQADWIVRELRLPRTLLAVLVGAGLATAGAVTQGVFRNPLADPGLIGVASGAALAAVAVIVLQDSWLRGWVQWLGSFAIPLAAFLGGLLVTLFIYRLGTRDGQTHIAMLLLAGVAINVLTGALTGILTYMADDQALRSMTFWSMGSLAHGRWVDVMVLTLCVVLPLLFLPRFARLLNALLLGENVATHLGFSVQQAKLLLIACAALMVGASVAVAGMIGFIGLVVPHLIRLLVGPDHRLLLPASALLGASLLLLADMIARTWLAPADLPIGLVMAVIGGPIFLSLLLKQVKPSA
ncbi:MAG: iron ABC transporter permease [Bacterioplanes sp.]|nr:iron ABC transporter permease [Bacterioplanes sp.]